MHPHRQAYSIINGGKNTVTMEKITGNKTVIQIKACVQVILQVHSLSHVKGLLKTSVGSELHELSFTEISWSC
jgi:hypothetical protein